MHIHTICTNIYIICIQYIGANVSSYTRVTGTKNTYVSSYTIEKRYICKFLKISKSFKTSSRLPFSVNTNDTFSLIVIDMYGYAGTVRGGGQ
jgi:hypothetical protein